MPPPGAAMSPDGAAMPMDPVQAVMAQLPGPEEKGLTPPELEQIAQTVAQQIFSLQGGQRQSALRALKVKSPTIHSLVKSLLEQLDGQIYLTLAIDGLVWCPVPTGYPRFYRLDVFLPDFV